MSQGCGPSGATKRACGRSRGEQRRQLDQVAAVRADAVQQDDELTGRAARAGSRSSGRATAPCSVPICVIGGIAGRAAPDHDPAGGRAQPIGGDRWRRIRRAGMIKGSDFLPMPAEGDAAAGDAVRAQPDRLPPSRPCLFRAVRLRGGALSRAGDSCCGSRTSTAALPARVRAGHPRGPALARHPLGRPGAAPVRASGRL